MDSLRGHFLQQYPSRFYPMPRLQICLLLGLYISLPLMHRSLLSLLSSPFAPLPPPQRMCSLTPQDVNFMLTAHGVKIDAPGGGDFLSNTGANKRSWYLASDGTTCVGGSEHRGACPIEDPLREYGEWVGVW
jgi:hypothetical protein